jgi:serine/threonine protein kinase
MKYKKKIKNINRSRKKNKNKPLSSIYDGGAAFAKGGFGCVFKPALNCKKSELNGKPNYVSKLIDSKHAKREYMYIYNIKKKLQHLPQNIKKYFLLDNVSVCEPGPLSESDKVKIEEVCDYILTRVIDDVTQEPINSKNINSNLDKFKIINMPELSVSLSHYIRKTDLTPFDLINLNNNIIEYLTTVIPVLYKNGVVHGDIKPDNMMFNMADNNTLVLIDWGLSYVLDDERKNVPEALQTLATQWHHPFSSFLFKKTVIQKYETLLEKFKKDGVKITRDNLREFALSEYRIFTDKHEKQFLFLTETLTSVYSEELTKKFKTPGHNTTVEYIYQLATSYIIEYIIDVLLTYTINYKLEIGRYFYEVYLLNTDTWGIMSTYNDLIETIPLMTNLTSVEQKMINAKLINMLTQNLYRNGSKAVNIPKLVNDIKDLNKYLMSISSKSSKKEIYGRVRRSAVSVRGNMDTRVLNLKKSMVDKGLRENKITFDKIEKYSSRRGRGRSTKRLSNIEIPVVTGGYNNRKSIKNMKTMKTRKTMKTGKK